MRYLDNILLRREQFPIVLHKAKAANGDEFWGLDRIEVPPYHPSMLEDGIPFRKAPYFLERAVQATIKDLEELVDRRPSFQFRLDNAYVDKVTGNPYYPITAREDENGIEIDSVPVVSHIFIGTNNINPHSSSGDQGITIQPENARKSFKVPEEIIFPTELMSEYEMKDEGIIFEKRQIACPHVFYRHNLADMNAIFYRNLVIELNNSVVVDKYSD